jgi:uncharacterized protein YjiS (DUF1127 family)
MISNARKMEPDRRQRQAAPAARTWRNAAVWLAFALLRWQELAQQRRRLLSLDDRMLKDIGITRAEAMREGTRPFWDAHGLDGTRWP